MTLNTLKQKARKFSAEHNVPYMTALKAVDEPLHAFRDKVFYKGEYTRHPRPFRIIGDEGNISSPYRTIQLPLHENGLKNYQDIIDKNSFPHFETEFDAMIETANRLKLIKQSGARNFWEYRMLYRAGLLNPSMPQIDPFLHYANNDIEGYYDSTFKNGSRIGIYTVFLDPVEEIYKSGLISPIRQKELHELVTGEKSNKNNVTSITLKENESIQFYCDTLITIQSKHFSRTIRLFFGHDPHENEYLKYGFKNKDVQIRKIESMMKLLCADLDDKRYIDEGIYNAYSYEDSLNNEIDYQLEIEYGSFRETMIIK